ncbi:hypothetical protein O3P69_007282 [Scylla paramamosain]|uniref:LRRCT domain-containing protein n=1 Tax=Scylla paramamosain TaxID=85552 RepID=A0AAW0V2I2_SCYPA
MMSGVRPQGLVMLAIGRAIVVMAVVATVIGDASRSADGLACPTVQEIHPCTCKVKSRGLSIACENVDEAQVLMSMSVLKNRSTVLYRLMFRNFDFPRVHDYSFLGLEVKHLTMSKTNISVVEDSSLRTLARDLETLDLSYNSLKAVPTTALMHLQNLSFLNLNYNMIKVLGQAVFMGLKALERLSLYNNQINHIDDNAFFGIGNKLYRVNLGKNHLVDVPNLHTLEKLEVLSLSENFITTILEGSFLGLNKLDVLMLENNKLVVLEANVFSAISSLNSLNLKHNLITNISDLAFSGLEDNLEWLEIGHNRLDHIPSHALRPLLNLRQLDLDSNRITHVAEDAFERYGESLKFLMLNRNNIREFLPMTFFDLHSLEWLKLSHNDLTHLSEDTVLPILDTLTMIDLSHNPLECDCDLMWLTHWLQEFMRRETYTVMAPHTCTRRKKRTYNIIDLRASEMGCPEYNVIGGSAASPPVLSGLTMCLLVASLRT